MKRMKLKKIIEYANNTELINSILIAILCMTGMISFVVKINNIIPTIIFLVFIIMEAINYKTLKKDIKEKNIKASIPAIIFLLIIIFEFIVSIINKGIRRSIVIRFEYFLIFILIPILCCRHNMKVKYIVKSIITISIILSPSLIFSNFGAYNGGTRMAISYYMLPSYTAFITLLFIDEKTSFKEKLIRAILVLILMYPYILFLIKYSSRGITIAIIFCILMNIIIKQKKRKRIGFTLCVIFICFISMISFKAVIINFNNFLIKNNITIGAINKSAKLLEKDEFDNGRNKVYCRAMQGISEHPFIGNGIGDYAEKYVTYPHNLLLQAWYEGGIIPCLAMLFILIYSIYILIIDQDIDIEKKYLLILFSSISLIRLMLSYEFWREISFGMYLYVIFDIMQEKMNIRRKKEYGKCNNTNI